MQPTPTCGFQHACEVRGSQSPAEPGRLRQEEPVSAAGLGCGAPAAAVPPPLCFAF